MLALIKAFPVLTRANVTVVVPTNFGGDIGGEGGSLEVKRGDVGEGRKSSLHGHLSVVMKASTTSVIRLAREGRRFTVGGIKENKLTVAISEEEASFPGGGFRLIGRAGFLASFEAAENTSGVVSDNVVEEAVGEAARGLAGLMEEACGIEANLGWDGRVDEAQEGALGDEGPRLPTAINATVAEGDNGTEH